MNAQSYETIDNILARYVAGTLPLPVRLLVDAHLELRPTNRSFVRGLEVLAGEELSEAPPAVLSDRDARLAAIFASEPPTAHQTRQHDSVLPEALRDFVGFGVDDIPWKTKLPGFREFDLGEFDGCHASMFWLRPGRKIPHHTHEGSEVTLVLDGAFNDGLGRYARGDISVANESTNHRPIAELDRPCIGFAVTDAPLKFNGPVGQRISDILGW